MGKIRISVAGCALMDYLYSNVAFSEQPFLSFLSKSDGDGGLSPGKLVFTEELEKYAATKYAEILHSITGGVPPVTSNLGGPGLVSAVHASQMLNENSFLVSYHGALGKDETANLILGKLANTPLKIPNYRVISSKATPFTDVFSDPAFDNGHGERTFVNNIGAAWDFSPALLPNDFFNAELVCFGGTALVPQIHDNLHLLLQKSADQGAFTVVNTVYDFRNEKATPGSKWPPGSSPEVLRKISLLIMDKEEALKISGTRLLDDAVAFFEDGGSPAVIITNGPEDIIAYSNGQHFRERGKLSFPVSNAVKEDLGSPEVGKGDTTGCGDNFSGGIIASLAQQMHDRRDTKFSLSEAISWGVASGGFACFYVGGTYFEQARGQKINHVQHYYALYKSQIENGQ